MHLYNISIFSFLFTCMLVLQAKWSGTEGSGRNKTTQTMHIQRKQHPDTNANTTHKHHNTTWAHNTKRSEKHACRRGRSRSPPLGGGAEQTAAGGGGGRACGWWPRTRAGALRQGNPPRRPAAPTSRTDPQWGWPSCWGQTAISARFHKTQQMCILYDLNVLNPR